MGKKRIIKKTAEAPEGGEGVIKTKKIGAKKRVARATLYILSTYNNTIVTLGDDKGNILFQYSAGAAGFKGSKKGTPYAASRAAEVVAKRAQDLGVEELNIRVKGIGSGRESAIRVFTQWNFNILSIKDRTPIPHSIPRLPKPRRV